MDLKKRISYYKLLVTKFPVRYFLRGLFIITVFIIGCFSIIGTNFRQETASYYSKTQVSAKEKALKHYPKLLSIAKTALEKDSIHLIRQFADSLHKMDPDIYVFVDDWETSKKLVNVNPQQVEGFHINEEGDLFEACKKTVDMVGGSTFFDYMWLDSGESYIESWAELFSELFSPRWGRIAFVDHYTEGNANWLIGVSIKTVRPSRKLAITSFLVFTFFSLFFLGFVTLSRARLNLWVESINKIDDALHILDSEGRVLLCNKASKEFYGFSMEGKKFDDIECISREDGKSLTKKIELTKEHDGFLEYYSEIKDDQKEVEFSTKLYSLNKNSSYVIGIDQNVTEKSLLLSTLYHDMNSGLVPIHEDIKSFLEESYDEEINNRLRRAAVSIEHLINLAETTKGLYRNTNGDHRDKLNLDVIIEKSRDFFGLSLASTGIEVKIREGVRFIEIYGYKTEVETIFRNLFSNAITSIRNSNKQDFAPVISVDFEIQDDFVDILFEDNGGGMDEELQEGLFREGANKGLGTNLITKMVKKNEGIIKVEFSKVGEGTGIKIRLPRIK